jgi:ribonuclease HI
MVFYYDNNMEEIRRLYDPAEDRCLYSIPMDQLACYNPAKDILQLQVEARGRPGRVLDTNSPVVFIDGACRGNGTPSARASYGVYFGPNSEYNTYGLLPSNLPQTSTRAEIEALVQALNIIVHVFNDDLQLSSIKIASDSSFLVNAMSVWMGKWIENSGIGSNGEKVAHFDVLRNLHDWIDWMEFGEDRHRKVQFWHVPRKMNREADGLANRAFALQGWW